MLFTLQIHYSNPTWLFIRLHASSNGVLAARLQSKASEPVLPHLLLMWDHASCCIVVSVVVLLLSSCIRFNLKPGEFLATVRKRGTFDVCLNTLLSVWWSVWRQTVMLFLFSSHSEHTDAFSVECCFRIRQYSTPLPIKASNTATKNRDTLTESFGS